MGRVRHIGGWGENLGYRLPRRLFNAAEVHAFPARRFGADVPGRSRLFSCRCSSGTLSGLRTDGWFPGVGVVASPTDPARTVLGTLLPREAAAGCRAEVIPEPVFGHSEGLFARFHVTYRYRFKAFLPGDYAGDADSGDCVAQWHGIPDRLLGERYRHAPVLLGIEQGRYFLVIAASARLVVPPELADDPARYDRFVRVDLGPVAPDLGRWVSWEAEIRWSYADDGMGSFALRRDGELLHRACGPNCFNDLRGGPYLKLGVYKWDWAKPVLRRPAGKPVVRFYSDIGIEAVGGDASARAANCGGAGQHGAEREEADAA